ncbi:MAG: aminoglycoside phosphotransferase family protein [Clostridia bacterium]|nr:aminoglycoside phosphotransferase family protein [Clostridia bacterium]
MLTFDQTKEILSRFGLQPITVRPFGSGNINDTYLIVTKTGLYTLQSINTSVFKDPARLMDNIIKVTSHILAALKKAGRADQQTLEFLHTKDGSYMVERGDRAYRVCKFIEAHSIDCPEKPEHLFEAGKAFGSFGQMLSDFDAETLYEVIPGFHDTAARFLAFEEAVKNGDPDRVAETAEEIEFVRSRRHVASVVTDGIKAGEIPLRVTHNDTKINNILFDQNDRCVAVIDLDTVMPGSLLYDFGDAMRSGGCSVSENESDLDKVFFLPENFEAYVRGYLSEFSNITPREKELLPFSALLLTYECGMRFLTDYLSGDVYFKTAYRGHNLVRARNQFALVRDIEKKMDVLKEIVTRY